MPNHVLGTLLSRAIFPDTGHVAIRFEPPRECACTVAAHDCPRAGLLEVPEEVDLAIVLTRAAGLLSTSGDIGVVLVGEAPDSFRALRCS